MAEDLSSLGAEDVRRLVEVIERLEHSAFDYLELEIGEMRVVLGKGDPPSAPSFPIAASPPIATSAPVAPLARALPPDVAPVAAAAVTSHPVAAPPDAVAATTPVHPGVSPAAGEGTVEITSPLMGIFYAQAEPGAPPFVTVGSHVESDSTVAIVEVMKLFDAVPAGLAGTIVEVLVANAELVEYGQALFRVRPD